MPTIFKDSVNIKLNLYADDTSLTIYAPMASKISWKEKLTNDKFE